jgi:hypothetical protein
LPSGESENNKGAQIKHEAGGEGTWSKQNCEYFWVPALLYFLTLSISNQKKKGSNDGKILMALFFFLIYSHPG